ncbi:MAG: hypothetical protein JST26_00195 [Bacteroidetes bacterium]|nr:hypothetical protein [Bacteroidota bacterium]
MSFFPIYSISTVGLRKHYNQDYLLHPERTDFTGGNGVGKSIIADLLQLMFIYDYDLIEFGTDGLKKAERQPYTLPYKTNDAYAFMNIEVSKGRYITIGVAIPNKKSRQIRPFVVLSDADMSKELSDLSFTADKMPMHRHFIKDGSFLPLEDLSKHFRDTYDLFLKDFTFKNEKDEYYNFLFNKRILCINLTIENNLNAFAKIIQSFSKARSLDIDNSKSLQDFLFEDSKEELHKSFHAHKVRLEKLLLEYKELDHNITVLEKKQGDLTALKSKEELERAAHRKYAELDVILSHNKFQVAANNFRVAKEKVESDIALIEKRKKEIPKLEKLHTRSDLETKALRQSVISFGRIQGLVDEISNIKKEIDKISKVEVSGILDGDKVSININDFRTDDIAVRVEAFRPIIEKYGSVSAMRSKVGEQSEMLTKTKSLIRQEIAETEELSKIVSLNNENTLLSKVIENASRLSVSQETILMYLSKVRWEKPTSAKAGDQYATSLDILSQSNISEDTKKRGYWFKSGDLHTFIPFSDQKQIFNDPTKLKQALQSRVKQLVDQKKIKEDLLHQIENFERGNHFDFSKLDIDYEFDQQLKDYTSYNEYNLTAGLLKNIDKKISSLEKEKSIKENAVKEIYSPISSAVPWGEIEKYIKKITDLLEAREKKRNCLYDKLADWKAEEKNLLKSHSEDLKKLDELEALANNSQSEFVAKEKEVKQSLGDFFIDFSKHNKITEKLTTDSKKEHADLREDYITDYKSIITRYDETKDQNSSEVSEQVNDKKYLFVVLENILLGSKIKHVDKIGDELREANRNRLNVADAIHETMLKIFSSTKKKYEDYEGLVMDLNTFFKGKKISTEYYFQIKFKANKDFSVDWIDGLQSQIKNIYKDGELPIGQSIEEFVEDFFRKATKYRKKISFTDLLNPKTYFLLDAVLTDENNNEIPGSTGETYAALVLLGIARLSKVQSENKGIKFIILEETSNLDKTNFNTFPDLAAEYGYQIITMTPKPYGSNTDKGWYLYHLIKGKPDNNVNYHVPASYFKTNDDSEDLQTYLENLKR